MEDEIKACHSWGNISMCRTIQDIPEDQKSGTWKEYLVSYRIWGWKDEVVDRVSITEKIGNDYDIDRKVAEQRTESPKSCNYNEKVYIPAYDEDDKFYWKLYTDRQHNKSGSCSVKIISTIGEDKKEAIDRTNERVAVRRNVFMVLLENTIAIDFHRITSKFPKYDEIKREILEYERSQGLDLSKVARVLILNMIIL